VAHFTDINPCPDATSTSIDFVTGAGMCFFLQNDTDVDFALLKMDAPVMALAKRTVFGPFCVTPDNPLYVMAPGVDKVPFFYLVTSAGLPYAVWNTPPKMSSGFRAAVTDPDGTFTYSSYTTQFSFTQQLITDGKDGLPPIKAVLWPGKIDYTLPIGFTCDNTGVINNVQNVFAAFRDTSNTQNGRDIKLNENWNGAGDWADYSDFAYYNNNNYLFSKIYDTNNVFDLVNAEYVIDTGPGRHWILICDPRRTTDVNCAVAVPVPTLAIEGQTTPSFMILPFYVYIRYQPHTVRLVLIPIAAMAQYYYQLCHCDKQAPDNPDQIIGYYFALRHTDDIAASCETKQSSSSC